MVSAALLILWNKIITHFSQYIYEILFFSHAHKSTVMSMKWNKNGNWFLTASRDHLLKLFDIRNMKSDFQTFKGHQKEATGGWIQRETYHERNAVEEN